MKILVTRKYFEQRTTSIHHLRVQVDQTGGHPIALVNCSQVDKILKVDHIDVGCTCVHKYGRTNQEQDVTLQCASSMILNQHIITFDI